MYFNQLSLLPNSQRKELTLLRIISLNATRTIVVKRLLPTRQLSSPHFYPCHFSLFLFRIFLFRIFRIAPVTSSKEKRSMSRRGNNDVPCCVFPIPRVYLFHVQAFFLLRVLSPCIQSVRLYCRLNANFAFVGLSRILFILIHLKNKF